MTKRNESIRIINNQIHKAVNSQRFWAEGVVVDFSNKAKMAQVKIFPENKKAWCRVGYDLAESGNIVGAMIKNGTRVLVAFLDKSEDIYGDVVIIKCLFDNQNVAPTPQTDGTKDRNYYSINPENGGSIELYKDNDNVQRLFITGLGKINIKSTDDVNMDFPTKLNVKCPEISLGDENLTGDNPKVVLKPHLDVYNSAIDGIINVLAQLINSPFTELGVPNPTPIAVRNPAASTALITLQTNAALPTASGGIKENVGSINVTTKVRAK